MTTYLHKKQVIPQIPIVHVGKIESSHAIQIKKKPSVTASSISQCTYDLRLHTMNEFRTKSYLKTLYSCKK